jgi:ABC-type multidrug transport system fused ATPase/permease subunit
LSFARALAYDPAVLILDEATSSVDAETEETIRRGLVELTQGRTSLVVAHRFSTLADADRLLVVRDGRLEREMTPGEFLRASRGG